MQPATFLQVAIRPTLAWLGPPFKSQERELMLLTVALQESSLKNRVQIDAEGRPIPHLARGMYQFERGPALGVRSGGDGTTRGVNDVLLHPRCAWLPDRISELGYRPLRDTVHDAVADNDILATLLATALLWSHPEPLPVPGEVDSAWAYYVWLWRPGRPRPEHWPTNYTTALRAIGE